MSPLRLTDLELDAVIRAARPIAVHRRDEFLQAVAQELAAYGGELGPVVVYRTVVEVQRRYFDPPRLTG